MSSNEMTFLVMIVSAFSLFGGVLAWASWTERREQNKRS